MIKILIAEDEPLSLQNLTGHLRRRLGEDALIEGVSNGREAVERARQIQPALIFMDIEMPVMNGLDAASILHKTQPDLPIIFLTAFDRFDYAVGAMRAGGTDYLLKPFSFADFSRSANKAYSLYELINNRTGIPSDSEAEPAGNDREHISIRADHKVSLIRISEIIYIESNGEYVRLHLADGSTIMTLFRIKNMETTLPSDSFMRVHRSYIVNLKCVTGYARGRIFLNNNEYVPIGENYKEAFQTYIARQYPTI